ncbi:uncharacterized protein SCHCODRAFT_02544309 [Schizophyllum commune H4-8]|uniref:uncharacterized protein n=1 Tax=Schizophyllum commune (strain H4-8 / FGSC 9210) TaxID=578458 RepID=UPI002160070E|nr:uncharacterized protein SCHCODRAFT_02544309 [Schizophyllum commune H4-8]KAI5891261.1 hypothetical protein SCHCODRAFT_02544309 [Schizophyllum commune H4-8]
MVALGYLHSAIYRHAVTSAPVSRNSAPCAAFQRRRASRSPLDESRCSCRRRALSCRRRRAKKANKSSHPTHPWTLLLWRCREPDASGDPYAGLSPVLFLWRTPAPVWRLHYTRLPTSPHLPGYLRRRMSRLETQSGRALPIHGSCITSTRFMTEFQPLNCRHSATALFISDDLSIFGQYRKPPRSSAKSGITVNLSSIDTRGRKTPAKAQLS